MNHHWESRVAMICLTVVSLFFIHSCTGFMTEREEQLEMRHEAEAAK